VAYLRQFRQLEYLRTTRTRITRRELRRLKEALPLVQIDRGDAPQDDERE
jgi:hypothetical protein